MTAVGFLDLLAIEGTLSEAIGSLGRRRNGRVLRWLPGLGFGFRFSLKFAYGLFTPLILIL